MKQFMRFQQSVHAPSSATASWADFEYYIRTICRTIQARLHFADGESLSQLCSKLVCSSWHAAFMDCLCSLAIDVVAPLQSLMSAWLA